MKAGGENDGDDISNMPFDNMLAVKLMAKKKLFIFMNVIILLLVSWFASQDRGFLQIKKNAIYGGL